MSGRLPRGVSGDQAIKALERRAGVFTALREATSPSSIRTTSPRSSSRVIKTSSVIFESTWPTWLITHLTSKALATRASDM